MIPASRWTPAWALGVMLLLIGFPVTGQEPARMTNRILFVVDTSGSMTRDDSARATDMVLSTAGVPTDDLQVKLITFSDRAKAWDGGWQRLPDPKVLSRLRETLPENGNGDTNVLAAMRLALEEPMRDLSIVLVTDGIFGCQDQVTLPDLIRGWQAARPQPANLAVVVIADEIPDHVQALRPNLGVYLQ